MSGLKPFSSIEIAEKIYRHLRGELPPAEQEELASWVKESTANDAFWKEVNDPHQQQIQVQAMANYDEEAALQRFLTRYRPPAINLSRKSKSVKVSVWVKWAAAVLIILGTAVYFGKYSTERPLEIARTVPAAAKDMMPGSEKAILTLSDGREVLLDSTAKKVIKEGSLDITNTDHALQYAPTSMAVTNTMTTPKGGQYRLLLADGTKVWLNAASSITYPTAFTGEDRSVVVSGEVYFEVAKNPGQPFVVHTAKENITVLGTSFNVNCYADEPQMKTSLIEGSVKVSAARGAEVLLKPGQAYVNGKIITTNTQQDVAWKAGLFDFDQTPIETVLRQISRWYNVEIVYRNKKPDVECTGELQRKLKLSQVVKVLQQLGVQCHIDNGSRLIIE